MTLNWPQDHCPCSMLSKCSMSKSNLKVVFILHYLIFLPIFTLLLPFSLNIHFEKCKDDITVTLSTQNCHLSHSLYFLLKTERCTPNALRYSLVYPRPTDWSVWSSWPKSTQTELEWRTQTILSQVSVLPYHTTSDFLFFHFHHC